MLTIKQKNHIKDLIKNEYKTHTFNETDIPDLVSNILQKAELSITVDKLLDYLVKYCIKEHLDGYLYFKVTTTSKKNKVNSILDQDTNKGEPYKGEPDKGDLEKEPKGSQEQEQNKGKQDKGEPDLNSNSDSVMLSELDILFGFQTSNKPVKYTQNKYTLYSPSNFNYQKVNYCNNLLYGPYSGTWINDVNQVDDILTQQEHLRSKTFDKLMQIKYPEQRTDGWFKMRSTKITASDGGTVLGVNKNEAPFKFIIKKVIGAPYSGNKFTHHGTKYEEVATMQYTYRMNVSLNEFGLCGHPTIPFLGASPDGIVNKYKADKVHLTKYVGRMLEIKCPFIRKIQTEGEIIDNICPIYYWVQVQLQLQCCELDECDFWQCSIYEYKNRTEFIEDTNPDEPFRSKLTNFEKGVIIQLLPKDKINSKPSSTVSTPSPFSAGPKPGPNIENGYWQTVYDNSMFIYPPKIEMTPLECDIWVSEQLEQLNKQPKYFNYSLDKVLYWRLDKSHNVTINRDDNWFKEKLPELEKMWNYVVEFRNNKQKTDLLVEYINKLELKTPYQEQKANSIVMDMVDLLYKTKNLTNIRDELDKIVSNKPKGKLVNGFTSLFEENNPDGYGDNSQFKGFSFD